MRIRQLRLLRYGRFTGRILDLPRAGQDIHLIVGPNEAGKSTLRQALSDWLFGIPARTPMAFLHPMPELRIGGVIEALAEGAGQAPTGRGAGRRLDFERTKGNRNTLRTPDDQILPADVLQGWLGSLQAEAFNRMHALDHSMLVAGSEGILNAADDMGRLLFQSAAGLARLDEALTQLQKEADALWGPRRSASRVYYQAHHDYGDARQALAQAQLRTRDWKARHDALAETARALAGARQRHGVIRQQLGRLERIRRVGPLLQALDEAQARLDGLAGQGLPPLLAEDAAEVFREVSQQQVVVEAEIRRLQADEADIAAALADSTVDQAVLALADEIGRLNERRLQCQEHPARMQKAKADWQADWQEAQRLARELGWPADDESALQARLPAVPVRDRLVALLRRHGPLKQALERARHARAVQQQGIAQAQQALAGLMPQAVDPALPGLLDEAMQLGDHAAEVAALQAQSDALAVQIDSLLAGMGAWRQPAEALAGMLVPALASVQALLDQDRTDEIELHARQQARDGLAQARRDLEQEMQHLVERCRLVLPEQVAQARRVRDDSWQLIRRMPDTLAERADAFEAQLREADALADARQEGAGNAARLEEMAARLRKYDGELFAAEQSCQAVAERKAGRLAGWAQQASACGLPALPLPVAPVWLAQRERVLALQQQQALLGQRLASRQALAGRLLASLSVLLGGDDGRAGAAAGGPDEPARLAACLQQARALQKQADQAQGQRDTLQQQLSQGGQALLALQSAEQMALADWDRWASEWQAALQMARHDLSTPPEQLSAQLALIADLERLLARMRLTRHEGIEALQLELDELAVAAQALAARLSPAPAAPGQSARATAPSTQAICLQLGQRLEAARQAEAAARALQLRQQQTRDALAQARQQQLAMQARIAPLLAAAQVSGIEALGPVIERSAQRRQIEARILDSRQQLLAAADGLALEALRAEAAGADPDALRAELEALALQAEQVVDEIATLSDRHGKEKMAFEALDGSDAAAQAAARQQEAVAVMADAAERYLRLHTAARLLKWSIERFRQTRQGPMLARASEIFRQLTLGSFERLLVDAEGDAPRLLGIRPDRQAVAVPGLSEGSRDQLYLALRLAALELQAGEGVRMPLVADDLFINFDDQRTAAGLQVLGEVSARMQVIFLTHHPHLVSLAREVLGDGLNVIEL